MSPDAARDAEGLPRRQARRQIPELLPVKGQHSAKGACRAPEAPKVCPPDSRGDVSELSARMHRFTRTATADPGSCPPGTYGVPPICVPQKQKEEKPKIDCPEGYRKLNKPNKYGAYCEPIEQGPPQCPSDRPVGPPPNCSPQGTHFTEGSCYPLTCTPAGPVRRRIVSRRQLRRRPARRRADFCHPICKARRRTVTARPALKVTDARTQWSGENAAGQLRTRGAVRFFARRNCLRASGAGINARQHAAIARVALIQVLGCRLHGLAIVCGPDEVALFRGARARSINIRKGSNPPIRPRRRKLTHRGAAPRKRRKARVVPTGRIRTRLNSPLPRRMPACMSTARECRARKGKRFRLLLRAGGGHDATGHPTPEVTEEKPTQQSGANEYKPRPLLRPIPRH